MKCPKSKNCEYGCVDGSCGHPQASEDWCPKQLEMWEIEMSLIGCEDDKEDHENGLW
jgi:hypothetical protein